VVAGETLELCCIELSFVAFACCFEPDRHSE
jgi:hypothetical protein